MSKPRRLHPIASIIQTGKRMKGIILPTLALIFSMGREGKEGIVASLIISFIVAIFTLITGILSWYRFTYRFEQDELRIEYGIFVRKKRYIPFERIQSIDLTEGILQRLFGLVKVQIETAGGSGGDEAEAVLSAISKEEAKRIQDYVTAIKRTRVDEVDIVQGTESIFKISVGQLVILSLTSGGVGVVISAVFAFLLQFDDFIPFKRLFGDLEKWAVQNLFVIAVIAFIGFFLAWVIALVGTMLKYANFTVQKTAYDLVISQGLLERRQITIPLNRIQTIRIHENILRQILGCGTVYVESAGGSAANQEGAKVMLLPIVRLNQIGTILEPHLTDYVVPASFTPLPKQAKWRYILRSCYIVVPIVIVSFLVLKVWGLFSFILFAISAFWAVLKYKTAGWSINQKQLSLRYRVINRTTVLMKKNKIQSLEMRESYFQRQRELGTIEAFVKSGSGGTGGVIIDMEKKDIQQIYEWYSSITK